MLQDVDHNRGTFLDDHNIFLDLMLSSLCESLLIEFCLQRDKDWKALP
jgi:hypothetical protein